MLRKVKNYIESNQLLPVYNRNNSIKIVVGLSGGADSIVLLYILHQLGYPCLAAHCNFHLRGEESNRDENLVKSFTKRLEIPLFIKHFDTILYAKEKKISIEMAARELRYQWFEELRNKENADVIAIAHHQDDNIETFILNLTRGTGIKGLTGIQPKNGNIIRPLLSVSKTEILEFAEKKNLDYETDSTNLQDEFTRNKIRLSIIPLMQTINPSINTTLINTLENLTEARKIYDEYIHNKKKKIFDKEKGTINIDKLNSSASPEAILFEILKDYGFNRDSIKNISKALNSQSGKEFYSSKYVLIKDRYNLLILPIREESDETVFEISSEIQMIETPLRINMKFQVMDSSFNIQKNKNIAYFDADKLKFPLFIRRWEKGDKFVPFGMTGFQKLSDYFTNQKLSKPDKENIWLLCSGNDIIWIIGHRTDNRYKISDNTRRIYEVKLF